MFRIRGALYHKIGSVLPPENRVSVFAQIYVTGGNDLEEACTRAVQAQSNLDIQLIFNIQRFMSENNSYA